MTSQPLFIPLYIDETEEDLWLALQRIEPDKRSFIIKDTLRQVLLGTDSREVCSLPQDPPNGEAQIEDVLDDSVERIEMFSLDDLFTQTDILPKNAEPMIMTVQEEESPIPNRSPGFEYLMKHIIGTEDDKEVIRVLNQGRTVGKTESQKPKG